MRSCTRWRRSDSNAPRAVVGALMPISASNAPSAWTPVSMRPLISSCSAMALAVQTGRAIRTSSSSLLVHLGRFRTSPCGDERFAEPQ